MGVLLGSVFGPLFMQLTRQSYSQLIASIINYIMMTPISQYTTLVSFLNYRDTHLQLPADNVTRISYRFFKITIQKNLKKNHNSKLT